jgi:enoyl-CoA hydratase
MAKVLYEKRNRIGYITLNRPDALNALDDELNSELWAVWEDFASDDSLDVGILTGAGKAFCAGADLKTFIPRWEQANMLDVRRNVPTGIGGGITREQHRITKPVIAAINGHAIAAVSSWPWPATSVSPRKRPNSGCLKSATGSIRAMAALCG